ncbi:hypothetical protein MferCBS31731_002107 [Microsporum ferrugineum]
MDNHPGADIEALIAQNCERRPSFTPISIYGLRWAGELNASIQVFAKDPITKETIEKAPRTTFFGPPEPMKGLRESKIYQPLRSVRT